MEPRTAVIVTAGCAAGAGRTAPEAADAPPVLQL